MHQNLKAAAAVIASAALAAGIVFALDLDEDDTKPVTKASPTVSVSSASPTPEATGPLLYSLNDKAKWGDVTITLDKFKRGRTTDVGVPEDTNFVRFTVALTNKGDKLVNLQDVTITCITQEVYDGTNNLNGIPNVHVRHGKTLTWDIACAQDKKERYLQVEVSPDRGDQRVAIFAGDIE